MQENDSIWGRARRGIPDDWPRGGDGKPEQPALVTDLPEGSLADMTCNMLSGYGIPTAKFYQEDGAFARVLFGASAYGVGIFVPASRQEEARALLEGVPGEDGSSENTPVSGDE
jgi:hypothetical protein